MVNLPERETSTVDQIVAYHEDVVEALLPFLQGLYERGERFGDSGLRGYEAEVRNRLAETDLRSSFLLLTAVEAALREDFTFRVKASGIDSVSAAFIELHERQSIRIRLDDLLAVWKEHHPKLSQLVSKLKAATHFRDWIAHEKYWPRPNNDKFDYASSFDLVTAILENFPLVLPLEADSMPK